MNKIVVQQCDNLPHSHGGFSQYGESRENLPSQHVTALMTALNLDMVEWWEPTAENYLSHVSKDRILTIVAEAVSPQHAQSMNGFKKGDLARHAEQALSGLRLPDNFKVAKIQEELQS